MFWRYSASRDQRLTHYVNLEDNRCNSFLPSCSLRTTVATVSSRRLTGSEADKLGRPPGGLPKLGLLPAGLSSLWDGFFLVVFVEQIIKCLYFKAEQSDQQKADKPNTANTDPNQGPTGEGGGGGGGGGVGSANGAGVGRYRFYNDKDVIPSTLEELDDDPAEGLKTDGAGGSLDRGSGAGPPDSALTQLKEPCLGFSNSAAGGVQTFSSSPDEHDSDSVGSDSLAKEEHNAFMSPLHTDLELATHCKDVDYDLEQVPVTLRCSHSLRQAHSLSDLGVTKVVKQLSQADLTRRAHFRSIIYIMALSLHGIFEGLALGLQSRETSVWSLCFALCLHRCVLAFQLGMDLCGARESQGTAFLCIGTFTLISALGIVLGILFSSGALLYADVTVPEAILQSLATGTIFYIVFFDILFKDLQGVGDLKRVSSCFVGFSLMAIILAVTTR
ncbi:hypothetical protein ACOMHN_002965 [Nucella lapillus]